MNEKKYLIIIAGPTAVGKTALTIDLARHNRSVVLSADSRQIYKEMNIGTAKPSPTELAAVPHYFIDHLSVTEDYNAGKYEQDVLSLLHSLFREQDIVFMTGGSGLYIRAVTDGFDEIPDIDPAIRTGLEAEYAAKGLEYLQERLNALDPEFYEQVDRQNPQRLLRALEVIIGSGRKYSAQRKKQAANRDFKIIKICLDLPREQLYKRIDQRVEEMLEQGLLDEARHLFPLRENNALQTVGYQELFNYLEGKYSLEEAVSLIKRNTRRYAKRQLTWFRREKDMQWMAPDKEEILKYIRSVTSKG